MYRRALLPILAQFDPELMHNATLRLLTMAAHTPPLPRLLRRLFAYDDARLHVNLWGLRFSNPLGIAAGLDKNGNAATMLLRLGWGHVEVGTVTPLPQPGNPRPRIFRLPADHALINRMGFPGAGADAVGQALVAHDPRAGILGINVGANRSSVEAGSAAADYVSAIECLAPLTDYVTVNISSPNTARLRELQGKEALAALLHEVVRCRDALAVRKPVLVKIAPDLTLRELDDVIDVGLGSGIDGIVATNTTITRPSTLKSAQRNEQGGLSGAPLRARSTEVVRYLYQGTAGRLPIIGVGGIFSAADAFEKLAAGASLVQIYTGFIYEGPGLASRINRGLVHLLNQHGLISIDQVIGSAARP